MPVHAFVDESKQRGFLLVAVLLSSADVTSARRAVRRLHLPRQRRIHFKRESSGRRHSILATLIELPMQVHVYECPNDVHELEAREACLAQLVEDLVPLGCERLVIEADEPAVVHDKRTLFGAVAKADARDQLRYYHMATTQECLLSLPDAIAWSWAEGGSWRRRVQPTVSQHLHL